MPKTLLILCLFLSACSSFTQQFEQSRLHRLKGQPKSAVTDLLGSPTQVIETSEGDTKLIYQTNYKTYTPSQGMVYLGGDENQQGQFTSSKCLTTFEIKNDIVSNVYTTGSCL